MAKRPGRPSDLVRALAVAVAVVLSLAALALLAEPELDLRWEAHRSHFSLVLSLAAISVGPRPGHRRGPASPPAGR
jgi:hypothetical protein